MIIWDYISLIRNKCEQLGFVIIDNFIKFLIDLIYLT